MLQNPQILSAIVHHGEHVELTKKWKDTDVICPDSKLFYVTDGEIIIETESETVIGKSGDMILIPAGTKHNFHLSTLGYAKKFWIHFQLTASGKNVFDYYSLPYKIQVGNNNYIESLFLTVLKSINDNNLSKQLSSSAALFNLISFYVEHCNYIENNGDYDEIDRAVNLIKNNYNERFNLCELAKIAGLSESYFIRKFKKRTGYSPMHYVNLLKIDKAKTMIEQSDLPISEIMEKLGFFDAAHFCKLFKMHCGYSPKKFREINGYRLANKTL